MIIKAKSWHWKLYTFIDAKRKMPHTLCEYFWKLILMGVSAPLIIICLICINICALIFRLIISVIHTFAILLDGRIPIFNMNAFKNRTYGIFQIIDFYGPKLIYCTESNPYVNNVSYFGDYSNKYYFNKKIANFFIIKPYILLLLLITISGIIYYSAEYSKFYIPFISLMCILSMSIITSIFILDAIKDKKLPVNEKIVNAPLIKGLKSIKNKICPIIEKVEY